MTDNCDWERHKLNALQQIFQEVMFHEVLAMVGEQKEVPPPGGEHIEVQQFYRQLSSNESNHKEWSYDKVKVAIEEHSRSFKYFKLNTRIKNWKVPEREIHDCTDWIWRSRECRRAIELLRCKRICYAGGNSRCTVNESLNVQTLRKVSKVLKSSNAKMVNTILAKEREFDLVRQEQAFYFVFVHVHLEHDIRALPNFIAAKNDEVGSYEIGIWENFRFFCVDVFRPYESAGAKVDGTGLYSCEGSRVDVYPLIITGQDAWASLALRGEDSLKLSHIPSWVQDKTDPLGSAGVLRAQYWDMVKIQNENWMLIMEVGSSDVQ